MRSLLIAGLLASAVYAPLAFAQEATPPAATTTPAADYNAETVVATVGDTDITLGNVIAMRDRLPAQYQDLPDETLMTGIVGQLVDQLVLANSLSADPASDPLAVRLQLENDRRAALAGEVAQKIMATPLDPAAVQSAYDKAVEGFAASPEFDASHILVKTEEEAKKLITDIEGGADFAEVAKANSTDGSAQQGGELGWFGKGQMVPEFETAVAGMKKGDVAGPIQTQFGWHVIKLNDTRDSAPPSFDEMKPQIEGPSFIREALQAEVAKLRAAANVEVKETDIPATAVRDSALLN